MISFLSPAMGFIDTNIDAWSTPVFSNEVDQLADTMSQYTLSELATLQKTSEAIAETNFERWKTFTLDEACAPAVLTYDGIAYRALNAATLDDESLSYLHDHLRLLTGLYGVLKPMDAIKPYRLEMKNRINVNDKRSLYDFWGDKLYQELTQASNGTIVNLASGEYSKCIEKYLQDETYVTVTFYVTKNDQLKVQSTAAKKARGLMARYIAEHKIDKHELLKNFCEDGYTYNNALSCETGKRIEYVFVK